MHVFEREGDSLRRTYHPIGTEVEIGLVYSELSGEYGNDDVENNRDFGFSVGAAARWDHGWVVDIDSVLFGSHDHTFSAGLMYHF